jgi:hypothetical protein
MKMGLETWSALNRHRPTRTEIAQLFAVVDRDLEDAGKGVSPDNRFSLAYNAALKLCTIALYAEGHEASRKVAGHHNTVTSSLPHTLGREQEQTSRMLSLCSRKRSQAVYEQVGVVTERDAEELVETARQLRTDVIDWLKRAHPELVPEGLKE